MLIGFTGRAGAGKDHCHTTLATLYFSRLLVEMEATGLPYDLRDAGLIPVERRSFADMLYKSAAEAIGATPGQLRDWKRDGTAIHVVRPESGFVALRLTVRQYLQRYGTEAHRELFDPDFWVNAVDLSHAGRLVTVTDVRFPNEARAIREAGGIVLRVVGPDDGLGDNHASEVPLPDHLIDGIVDNSDRTPGLGLIRELTSAILMARGGAR
jgi:hypothetical protein